MAERVTEETMLYWETYPIALCPWTAIAEIRRQQQEIAALQKRNAEQSELIADLHTQRQLDNDLLKAQIAALTRERDEARRELQQTYCSEFCTGDHKRRCIELTAQLAGATVNAEGR